MSPNDFNNIASSGRIGLSHSARQTVTFLSQSLLRCSSIGFSFRIRGSGKESPAAGIAADESGSVVDVTGIVGGSTLGWGTDGNAAVLVDVGAGVVVVVELT